MPATSPRPARAARLGSAARHRRHARLALLLVTLCVAPVGAVQVPLTPTLPHLPMHSLEAELLVETNVERVRAGLDPVRPSEPLAQAARHHVEEMVRLGYFSHVSPTPGREGVPDRVAAVGGTVATVGENLAAVSQSSVDPVRRAIDGWLASPGHRENLLEPNWTHVGFGVADGPDGRRYLAQVFAYQPDVLLFAHAAWSGTRSVSVRFEVRSEAAGWLTVTRVGTPAVPVSVDAGEAAEVTIDGLDAGGVVHLGLAWGDDLGRGLIGQESGWFDPATGVWSRDWRSDRAVAAVLGHRATPARPDASLQLVFAAPPVDVVVLIDGREAEVAVTGTVASLLLPWRDGDALVQVGTAIGDGRVAVVHALRVRWGDGGVAVAAAR